MTFEITSPAFGSGERIPDRYTGAGPDVSPPLRWWGAPPGTRGFVLTLEDPDAPHGTFGHWAVFVIPADWTELPEDVEHAVAGATLRLGRNDAGEANYSGPYPPRGHGVHHYHFRLTALDTDTLDLPAGASVRAIRERAAAHRLAQAELIGLYDRT